MRVAVGSAAWVLATACGEADSSAPGAAVRDSAGVRIVEYAEAPPAEPRLVLSEAPIYRHGGRPGDRLLARVQAGVLRADGSAVLVDVGSGPGAAQEVFVLGSDGSLQGVLATGGQGPEEVRGVAGLFLLPGDSLLVEDRGNGKWMVFAGDRFVRSVALQARPELARGLRIHGVDADGGLLMATASYSLNFEGEWLDGSLVRVDPRALSADTVGAFEMAFRQDQQAFNPFAPDGLETASGGRFVTLRTDRPQIVWRGADGAVRQIVRWHHEPVPVTEADLEPLLESMRVDMVRVNPGMTQAEADRYVEERKAMMHIPPGAALPIAQTIRGDVEGRVWLPEYVGTMSAFVGFHPSYYTVVDADGTWLGRVAMPPRFRLVHVAFGRVLGVQLDELDVEHVVVYELTER